MLINERTNIHIFIKFNGLCTHLSILTIMPDATKSSSSLKSWSSSCMAPPSSQSPFGEPRPGRWPERKGGYRIPGGSMSVGLLILRAGPAVRPSWGEIFLRMWGECSFGLGFAEWRFLDLRELNIIEHPATVHLCISRRWTALKWIFRAPLSQNVLRQTAHWTRLLPGGKN